MKTWSSFASALAALVAAGTLSTGAQAATFSFQFAGPGVSGFMTLTYGSATDAKYPGAFEVSNVTGTFSDSNNGLNIVNAPIGSLVAINHAIPDPTNLLAPADFSRFAVAAGLGAENNGYLTYDNLYYPGGSPQTATDYPVSGGFLDIYGLMFNIGGGRVIDFWSNGLGAGGVADYGVAVATPSLALDYVSTGVAAVPEPGSLWLLAAGLPLLALWRRRAAQRR